MRFGSATSNDDALFGRQSHAERRSRAVEARIHHRVELECEPELVLGEPLHREDFVLVDGDGHGLEAERETALLQQPNPAQASIVGARDAGEPLVGLTRPAVERDLDREWPLLDEPVGECRRDERAVGEERNQQSPAPRVRIDVDEVTPRKNLAARIQQPETAGVSESRPTGGSARRRRAHAAPPRGRPSEGCCSSART